jgi:hypothetical protein
MSTGTLERPTKKSQEAAETATPENEEKAKNARRDARAVSGAVKARNFMKKHGAGQRMRRVGAGMGATVGAMKGGRKGQKKAEEDEAKGKKLETSRTKMLAKEGAKEAAKYFIDKKAKEIAIANAGETFGLSIVAYYGIKHWKVTLTLILALFLLIFLLFDSSSFDPPQQAQQDSGTPTTNDSCFPATASYNQTSVCTITVTYGGNAQDITVTDTILPGTEFVSAGQKGVYDKTSNTVTWDAAKDGLQLEPVNFSVTVTVRITTQQVNVRVYNAYEINPTGLSSAEGGGSGAIPGNLPPNTNDCSGVYAAYMAATPGHQNYGDPTCSLVEKDPNGNAIINKDLILKELQTLKSDEAMAWFVCIVPNESGYNANAYLGASTSGNGAYGLVQMNPTGKGNGSLDDGEVVWSLQLSNGIQYNDTKISHTFTYWPTSYDPCIRSYGVTVN